MTKHQKNIWEKIFDYPSFNMRFGLSVALVIVLAGIISALYFFLYPKITPHNTTDTFAFINLVIQLSLLILGGMAAYYALRQLIETRFNSLEQAGMDQIKDRRYSRAIEKWKEALYIRPDSKIFINLCEAMILAQEYDLFDQYIKMSETKKFKQKVLHEPSEHIIMLYLQAIRHLVVKNQGEAEKHITKLVKMVKKHSLRGLHWDFMDFKRSPSYLELSGECKQIADNLVMYLEVTLPKNIKEDFENGNYSSTEPPETTQ